MALANWTAVCWAPAHVEQDASGLQRAAVTPEAPRGSMTRTWPRRARWARVARSRSGLTEVATRGAGPFQDFGDDQGGGLVAAGGAEDQDRVAVLGRQQPTHEAGGAAQDHPAHLRLADGQQAQFAIAGPDRAGMLGRPRVPWPVAGGPSR
jgi:hypothetical protein